VLQDDGTNLLDNIPEAQQKVFILNESINVCEALIGYKVYTWNNNSQNCAQEINSLFQIYARLCHCIKVLNYTYIHLICNHAYTIL